jgi:hypothetical protein
MGLCGKEYIMNKCLAITILILFSVLTGFFSVLFQNQSERSERAFHHQKWLAFQGSVSDMVVGVSMKMQRLERLKVRSKMLLPDLQ